MTAEPLRPAPYLIADLIRTETVKIEGSLRAIRDVAGMPGAQAAAQAALQRVCRAYMNDNDGWCA